MNRESVRNWIRENFIYVLWKRFRNELLARPGFVFGIILAVLLLAALFYWPVRITRYGKLNDLDQVLFQLFLVALSGAISWVLAKRQEERNVLAKQKALANSAVRRIASIAAAAARLGEAIEARKVQAKSSTDWIEMEATHRILMFELFDSLSRQVMEMRDNIEASEGDWRDILPEEFAKKEQAESEILKAREVALQQKQKVLEELQQALTRGEARTAEQISALKAGFAQQLQATAQNLSLTIEQIRSRLPSTVVASGVSGWQNTSPMTFVAAPSFLSDQYPNNMLFGTNSPILFNIEGPLPRVVPDLSKSPAANEVADAHGDHIAAPEKKQDINPDKK
jgi:hypothetical protein